jgi:hypothetical protein
MRQIEIGNLAGGRTKTIEQAAIADEDWCHVHEPSTEGDRPAFDCHSISFAGTAKNIVAAAKARSIVQPHNRPGFDHEGMP